MVSQQEVQRMCLVQLFFHRRCMLEAEARKLVREVVGSKSGHAADADYREALEDIGARLHPLKLQLRTFEHAVSKAKYIALINTKQDAAAKLAAKYSFAEMQLFNHVIEDIASITSANPADFVISKDAALHLNAEAATQMSQVEVKKGALNLHDKRQALQQMVADMWLAEEGDEYSIGPRTFLELTAHLKALAVPGSGLLEQLLQDL